MKTPRTTLETGALPGALNAMTALCGAVILLSFGVIAGACGNSTTPRVQPASQDAESSATAVPKTINDRLLPVRLQIPGAPGPGVTATAAAYSDFGDYLHVVDLAAGTARLLGASRLASKPDTYNRPVLSPDRGRLAYVSRRNIIVIDIATGVQQSFSLPSEAAVDTPCLYLGVGLSWAPDSNRLAINMANDLLVMETNTGLYHTIATHPARGRCSTAWSPDGTWIVFDNNVALVRIHPDGSGRVDGPPYYAAPDFAYAGALDFVWAPDSAKFFFTSETGSNGETAPFSRISFVSGLDLRARGIPIGKTIAWQTEPMHQDSRELPFVQALSASGEKAAYVRFDHDANYKWTTYLETRDIDGTSSRTLNSSDQVRATIADAPFWSPDDSAIAYPVRGIQSHGEFGGVHVVNAASGDDLAAVRGPDSFGITNSQTEACDVLVVGWISTTSIVTLTTCEGGE